MEKHLLTSNLGFHVEGVLHQCTIRLKLVVVDEMWLHRVKEYTRLSLIVSSMLSSWYYYLEAKGRVANFFFFFGVRTYHDSINDENSSCLIILISIQSMLRDIDCGNGLLLHLI